MLKIKKQLLYSSVVLASISISNISHSSDLISEEEINQTEISVSSKQVSKESGWGMLWPGNWFGAPEEIDGSIISGIEKETTNAPTNKNVPSIEEVLSNSGVNKSIIFNVLSSVNDHISLSEHFDETSLVKYNMNIGKNTVSLYDGAIYHICYKGKSHKLDARQMAERGIYFQRYAILESVTKDGLEVFKAAV